MIKKKNNFKSYLLKHMGKIIVFYLNKQQNNFRFRVRMHSDANKSTHNRIEE